MPQDEILEASEITNEEAENIDEPTLIVTGDETSAVVTPYQCSECGEEFTCSLGKDTQGDYTTDFCPACGAEFSGVDDSAIR